jgi:hypothetical protein
MTPRPIKYRATEKEKYLVYQKKATDFFQGALDAYQKQNWNSTGLESIHCIISAIDMLTVYFSGRRCAGPDHYDSVVFLEQVFSHPEVKEQSARLRDILSKKNLIEYEGRNFTHREAEDTLKKCERFLNWAKKQIR